MKELNVTRPTPTVTAIRLAAEVNQIVKTTMDFIYEQEAKMMERLWLIRREFNDDVEFATFICDQTELMPGDAIKRVLTWNEARNNRELRELAQARPRELMRVVVDLVDGGLDSVARDAPEVVKIMAMPPRKRSAEIKRLLEHQNNGKHHPADREEIEVLKQERDAAVKELENADKVVEMDGHPLTRLNQFIKTLKDIEQTLLERNTVAGKLFKELAGEIDAPQNQQDQQDQLMDWNNRSLELIDGIGRLWMEHLGDAYDRDE